MSVYYASKEYVRSFSEALSEELKGTGVTVTASAQDQQAQDLNRRQK